MSARPKRVLILGGTVEGRELAEALANDARFSITVSLAGRTQAPAVLPVPVRSGGFGGASGLEAYLRSAKIDVVIDATHPFAATIKANAAIACASLGLSLLVIQRPGWQSGPGDRWISAANLENAIEMLGTEPRCVFVTVGRSELDALQSAPQHIYLIRSVHAPDPPPDLPQAHYITDRGPFSFAREIALMRDYGIEWLVTKNSGGESTYSKIEAARRLALPVAMIERPVIMRKTGHIVETVPDALRWLEQCGAHSATS